LAEPIAQTKLRKFGLSDWLGETTLLFDLSLYLDRTLAQQKVKSKVKVTQWLTPLYFNLYYDRKAQQSCFVVNLVLLALLYFTRFKLIY